MYVLDPGCICRKRFRSLDGYQYQRFSLGRFRCPPTAGWQFKTEPHMVPEPSRSMQQLRVRRQRMSCVTARQILYLHAGIQRGEGLGIVWTGFIHVITGADWRHGLSGLLGSNLAYFRISINLNMFCPVLSRVETYGRGANYHWRMESGLYNVSPSRVVDLD